MVELESDNVLGNIARNRRCLLYEQLAYDHPDFWPKESLITFSPEQEARIHLRRFRILLLYFDCILIQYNNILNQPLQHREDMMLFLCQSEDFKSLIATRLILLVGKGGLAPSDIVLFHRNYIAEFGSPRDHAFQNILQTTYPISRSTESHPDHELLPSIRSSMRKHLRKNSAEYLYLEKYTNNSANNVGNDIRYPPIYRDLSSLDLNPAEFQIISKILYTAE